MEGSVSQQPLIGSCSPVAFPDWAICSGRCCEARRGGASGPGAEAGLGMGGEGLRLGSGPRAAVTCRVERRSHLPSVPLVAPTSSNCLQISKGKIIE